jgi:hypothetical protein
MTRRDALIRVIDCLHAEIAALKANDVAALETATAAKLSEAHRLNEIARIYVNLMAANVRRRLQMLAGEAGQTWRGGGMGAYA